MYGNEDSVGVGIERYLSSPSAPSRDSIFVTTKLNELASGKSVRDALNESLRKLRLKYVDLYLIHSPIPYKGNLKKIWKQFEGVHKEGLAKNIGVSNFRLQDFEEFINDAEVVPACNQIEFNPYLLKATGPLLEYHEKHNILTSSFGGLIPLYQKSGGPLDPLLPSLVQRLSKDSGKQVTDSQILIKWLLAKNVLPITTSSKKSRLVNLLETVDLPDLTVSEINAIDEAGKKVHHRVYQTFMDS